MSYRYCEAFAEVEYILTGLKTEEIERIPKNLLEVIHTKKAMNYIIDIDLKKSLFEQNLKNETLAILAVIYRKYLADSTELVELEKHYNETMIEPTKLVEIVDSKKPKTTKHIERKNTELCVAEKGGLWIKLKNMWKDWINKRKRR